MRQHQQRKSSKRNQNIKTMAPKAASNGIGLNKFLLQADILAKSIGLIPYDEENGKRSARYEKLMKFIFILNMVNMNFVLFSEIMYVLLAMKNGNNFVEATMNLSYIGFVFVGDIKIISVLRKKPVLTILMKEIQDIYPKDVRAQKAYQVREYVWRFNLISLGFVIVHEILIWFYNLYIAVSYLIYEWWLQWRVVPRTLPYYFWVPWQWQGHWSYYILYVSQNFAGHTCMSGQLANDLFLCVAATQIIMHFEFLAKRLREYRPTGRHVDDLKFLREHIKYHQAVIHLSALMNEVFGVSLLVNFISSSFVMCFLGFQMTIGVEADTLVMLFMFLFCSLVQILMICNYGQQLIIKSEEIGHAVYSQEWLNSDLRYRKMLIGIIARSQKPVILRATTFLNVSRSTMTELMQLSYKFFALLRTMYSK
ncbi:putative odorant receptor 85d isoform X2 [Musca domestica]|uniref:Odorant receptor n=1 Tax=Musca domestica TaxID=7370 RepID=A0ABM3VFF8_MUSDO|nr:putative odorant receptor 85d isoform X1 [Musca domestica]XP_058984535.1 putative odorant receptor 85d isoform X2 [Musca domestica]